MPRPKRDVSHGHAMHDQGPTYFFSSKTFNAEHTITFVKESHFDVATTIKELEAIGMDSQRFSIVHKLYDCEKRPAKIATNGAGSENDYKAGAFWGDLSGQPNGVAFFLIPSVGTVVVSGPIVFMLASILKVEALSQESSALTTMLNCLGVPDHRIAMSQQAIIDKKYLLFATCTEDEIIALKTGNQEQAD